MREREPNRRGTRLWGPLGAAAAIALVTLALLPAAASAEQPRFWKSCETGSGAGQCESPRGIGVDPDVPGHLYVGDQNNYRIVELSAWGQFQKAWGWGVADGSPELQVCTAEAGCERGLAGSGAGQFGEFGSQGMAVDSAGNVYVVDLSNRRVQKFSPAGEFLLMFGGEVNQTKVASGTASEAEENLCPFVPGDVCKIGVTGTGQGQFGAWPASSFIAVDTKGTETDADDVVYVGDVDRIQEFDTDGVYQGEIALPEAGQVGSLAVDRKSGDLYFSYPPSPIVNGKAERPFVYRLDPETGAVLERIEVAIPGALAVDTAGNLYAFDQQAPGNRLNPGNHITRLLKFDDEGDLAEVVAQNKTSFDVEDEAGENVFTINLNGSPVVTGIATGEACLSEGADVYAANSPADESFVRAFGPPPDDPACPPERSAPSIESSYAVSVGTEEAQIEARINPRFWSGAQGTTTYFVQYATAACLEAEPEVVDWEAPCVKEHPAPPGSVLKAPVADEAFPAPVLLTGLEPATAYRFRFLAEATDSEGVPTVAGQPVVGVGGVPGEEGAETAFRTFAEPKAPGGCPNEALRAGPSAGLPDCRAYELVSPVDKANGDIVTLLTGTQGDLARLNQAATSGEALTYSSYRAFADPEGAPYSSQYIARRGASGWSSENVSPPQKGPEVASLLAIGTLYRHFSPELENGWIQTATDPVLAPGGQEGYLNVYRRDNESGGFEACTTVAPPVTDSADYLAVPLGVSADGEVAVFRANDKLTAEASPRTDGGQFGPIEQLYTCAGGEGGERQISLASVLPAGVASQQPSMAGTGGAHYYYGRDASLAGALSEDGTRLYWGTGGRLYLRTNPAEPQSAQEHGSAQGAGDLIGPAGGVGRTFANVPTIFNFEQKEGVFAVGQEVSGPCLKPATTVTAVNLGAEQLGISQGAASSCLETEIVGHASEVVSDLSAQFGAFAPEQTIGGSGIAPGTTIEAVGAEGKSLTLSAPATETGSDVSLEAFSECTEPARACTVPVSGAGGAARFWAARPDGSAALFTQSGALYRFEAASENAEQIAEGVEGLAGWSADLSRVYFASTEALPVEANSEGEAPVEEQLNLYLHESGEGGGAFAFIGTLAAGERDSKFLSPINASPNFRTARATPDGSRLAFTTSARLTGYDNSDRMSGEPAAEVYLYDAGSGELLCVSCNPSGARPAARMIKRSRFADEEEAVLAAAHIPPWMNPFHAPRALSEDGRRLFFNAEGALALGDINGKQDVYQWEEPGVGSCVASGPSFSEQAGGCVELISSGRSRGDSEFIDADRFGEDAFFATEASLVPHDPGLVDIYDARAGGGLSPPADPPPPCEGEACQSPAAAPEPITPSSALAEGGGNLPPPRAVGRCARGARAAGAASRRARRLARAAGQAETPRGAERMRDRARRSAARARRLSREAKRCRSSARRQAHAARRSAR